VPLRGLRHFRRRSLPDRRSRARRSMPDRRSIDTGTCFSRRLVARTGPRRRSVPPRRSFDGVMLAPSPHRGSVGIAIRPPRPARSAHDPPGPRVGVLAVAQDLAAVHEHVDDAGRVLVWLLESSMVLDSRGVSTTTSAKHPGRSQPRRLSLRFSAGRALSRRTARGGAAPIPLVPTWCTGTPAVRRVCAPAIIKTGP
jgi:hypothetical protein